MNSNQKNRCYFLFSVYCVYFVGRQVFLPIYRIYQRLLRLPKVSLRHLRRRRGRRRLTSDRRVALEVMDVEVLLEVEVRELVRRREVEELEESRITLDVVLVLEVLLLDVRRDELRDV